MKFPPPGRLNLTAAACLMKEANLLELYIDGKASAALRKVMLQKKQSNSLNLIQYFFWPNF